MAGQEKLRDYDRDILFLSKEKSLLKQADLFYLKENFEIQTSYDKSLLLHSFLYMEALDNNDCDLIKWIDKKIRGKLENTKTRKKGDLVEVFTDGDIHIHNHYYNNDVFNIAEW